MTEQACRTDRLYHYLLSDEADLAAIVASGLLPLSARPDSARWQMHEAARPNFYRDLYALFAEPVLQRPYRHSGIFLTPIDFRRLPGLAPTQLARVVLPLSAIDAESAVLTYELAGQRIVFPASPETLIETARQWPDTLVRDWFGRDPSRLFYFVPQVAVYQEGAIPVRPEWVEAAADE